MDRLERLVNLVAALLDSERALTREQIYDRVGGYGGEPETARRTFERDKDLLRSIGLPLVLEPADPEHPDGPSGYRVPRERYELPDPGLADDELAALRLAASAVAVEGAWGRSATTSALWKLAGAGGPRPEGPISGAAGSEPRAAEPRATETRATEAGTSGDRPSGEAGRPLAVAELPAGDQLAVIFEAVTERRRLRFSYRGHPRRVDPWRMAYRNGHWFLSGWDHLRQAERLFRMDRLEFAQADSEAAAFERPPGAAAGPPPPWSLGGDESIEASVLVDPVQASAALAVPGAGEMAQQQPDGSVLLHLRVNNRAALRTFVLGFLDHAEVLGPPDLRAEIISWLGDLASRGTRAGEQ